MITSRAALEIILAAKDEASDTINKVGSSFGSMGGLAMGAATGGLAIAAGAVAGLGAAALNFTQDADDAMRNFSAQTGVTGDDLQGFRDIAMDVWSEGWGESFEDAAGAMATVRQGLNLTGDELGDATADAMTLSEVFGTDINESVAQVSSMMNNFGVDSDAAFDIITKGTQLGLDRFGDFGDTLHEYSSDFQRMGFDAEDMLGALNEGLAAGAYNTDVVADGIREFGIRFMGAEDAAVSALDAIGVNTEGLYEMYQNGEITVAEAMDIITGALGDVDDKTLQAQAGAALFGSKWEDVGGDVFLAAGQAKDAITDVAGATDAAGEAVSGGFGGALESLKRSAMEALVPLGDALTPALETIAQIAKDYLVPAMEEFGAWLGVNLPIAMAKAEEYWHSTLQPALKQLWEFIQENVIPVLADIVEWLQENVPIAMEAAKKIWDTVLKPALVALYEFIRDYVVPAIADIVDWLKENIPPAMQAVADFWNNTLKPAFQNIIDFWNNSLKPVFEVLKDYLEDKLKKAWDDLTNALDWARVNILNPIRDAFDAVSDAISGVWNWIQDLIDSLGSIEMPDWLKNLVGGSSAPLNIGFSSAGPPALAGAGSGGGPTYNITNVFNRDAVRSDADIDDIARRLEESLLHQGARWFGV